MYCKKCGFKLDDGVKVCPFCNHSVDEEIKNNYINEEKVEEVLNQTQKEVVKEDVRKQEYVNINEDPKMSNVRNKLGYVNLKTKWFVHALIAAVGYGSISVLVLLIASVMLVVYKNTVDFSCINNDLASCPIETINLYNKISCIAQVVAELLIVAIVMFMFRKHLKTFFRQFKEGKTFKWFGISFGLMYGLTLVYSIILQALDLVSTSENQNAVNDIIINNPLLGFVFVVIAAPIFEEIIFRFGVFRAFTGNNKKTETIGIIVTTILFAMIHMSATFQVALADINNIDFELIKSDLLSLPQYLIGAFCLTFAYYKSKNLMTSMFAHMAWNLMAFIGIIGTSILPSEAIINFFHTIIETLTRLF